MLIYSGNRIPKLSDRVDSSGMLYYTLYLRPPVWGADKELIEGGIVRPSTPTGYYYQVSSSGVTGSTEPAWGTKKGEITTDNTVEFSAVNNNAYLPPGASLLVSGPNAPVFTTTDGVPIADSIFTPDGEASVQVGPIPTGVTEFTLKLTFFASTGHTLAEKDERSVLIRVTER